MALKFLKKRSKALGPQMRFVHRLRLRLSSIVSTIRADPKILVSAPWRGLVFVIHPRNWLYVVRKILKYVALISLGSAVLASLLLLVASWVFDEEDVNRNLSKLVRDSMGAEVTVEKTDLNFFKGITFEHLILHPNKSSLESNKEPLLQIGSLNIHWDFLKIFLLQVHIPSLEIVDPKISLRQEDGRWNFQSILDHQAAQADDAAKAEAEDPSDEKKSERVKISDILPIHPANILILPFKLDIDSVGFQNLDLAVQMDKPDSRESSSDAQKNPDQSVKADQKASDGVPQEEELVDIGDDQDEKDDKKVAAKLQKNNPKSKKLPSKKLDMKLNGLSTSTEVHWLGTDSDIKLRVFSPKEHPFQVLVKEDSKVVLDLQAVIEQTNSIRGLNDLELKLSAVLKKLAIQGKDFKNLKADADLKISLLKNLEGITIKHLSADILDLLKVDASGDIKFLDEYIDQFDLRFGLKQSLDLDKANGFLAQLGAPLSVGGQIAINNFSIIGPLKPSELDEKLVYGTVPAVSADVSMKSVKMSLAELGIELRPMSMDLDLGVDATPGQDGIQVDLANQVHGEGLTAVQDIEGEVAKVDVGRINQTLAARLSFPDLVVPFVRLGLEIDKITTTIGKQNPITMPLMTEIFTSISEGQKRITVDVKTELEDLLDFSLYLNCKNRCNKLKLNQSLQLDDFSKLYAFVMPILPKFVPLDLVPKSVKGKLSMATSVRASSKNIQETDINKILKGTQGKINFTMDLDKFSTEIPKQNIVLKNYDSKVSLAGTFDQQSIDFSQGFDQFSIDLAEDQKKKKSIKVSHLSFDTMVKNSSDFSSGLEDILKKLTTEIKTDLFVGQLNLGGILPHPINSLSFKTETKQAALEKIQIKQATFKVPDLGAELSVSGTTDLSPKFLPRSINIKSLVTVQHAGGQGLTGGIETSGQMLLDSRVESDNMKVFKVFGKSSFDDFHLKVPSAKAGSKPILLVQKVNGDFPLTQSIDISPYFDFEKLAAPSSQPVPKSSGDQKLATQTADESASDDLDADADEDVDKDQVALASGSKLDLPAEAAPKSPNIGALDAYFENNNSTLSDNTNLVGHADFTSVKSFYPENKTLTIQKIEAANLELSDLEFDIEVKQNWFSLSQFSIGFLGGKIQGDIKLGFNPIPDKFQLTVHATRLNTTKLLQNFEHLKDKTKSWDLFSDPDLDMNVHLNYDIKNNDMVGGIDITKIGKEQLKMMLFYLDPDEKNPSLGFVRTALNFGDISGVSIPIKSGFIGFDVGVTFLAIPIPLPKLDRFPIAQLISNFQVSTAPKPEASQSESEDENEAPNDSDS